MPFQGTALGFPKCAGSCNFHVPARDLAIRLWRCCAWFPSGKKIVPCCSRSMWRLDPKILLPRAGAEAEREASECCARTFNWTVFLPYLAREICVCMCVHVRACTHTLEYTGSPLPQVTSLIMRVVSTFCCSFHGHSPAETPDGDRNREGHRPSPQVPLVRGPGLEQGQR